MTAPSPESSGKAKGWLTRVSFLKKNNNKLKFMNLFLLILIKNIKINLIAHQKIWW